MNALLQSMDKVSNTTSKLGLFVAGAFIAVVTTMICINVVLRSVCDINMRFVEEYAMLAMVPMSYLGLGYTLRQNKHIAADILVSRVAPFKRHIMLLVAAVFGFFVLCFFLERAWDILAHNWTRGITSNGPMRTPMWIPSLIILIGLGLFIVDVFLWIVHLCCRLANREGLRFVEE